MITPTYFVVICFQYMIMLGYNFSTLRKIPNIRALHFFTYLFDSTSQYNSMLHFRKSQTARKLDDKLEIRTSGHTYTKQDNIVT
jgi:hypothetical protein